ncbi:MAG: hypothetical protein JRS35_07550 [Deltaproteobacteria bacterium]|nr:hypothetical protein [Deltaproteobacteria bacterium]
MSQLPFSVEQRSRALVLRLLKQWRKTASALGDVELSALLDVQVRAGEHPFDWSVVLAAFADVPKQFRAAGDRLFASWRAWMVQKSEPGSGAQARESESWVYMLLGAARDREHGGPAFRRELRAWLQESAVSRDQARARRDEVAVLTLDLERASRLRKDFPKLYEVLKTKMPSNADVTRARRQWLKHFKASSLMPEVVRFWQRSARMLLPDLDPPGYERCVAWLGAVHELDRRGYEQIMQDWRREHGRKRNLWAEIARQGSSPPAI